MSELHSFLDEARELLERHILWARDLAIAHLALAPEERGAEESSLRPRPSRTARR